jgi:hypothetical protein
MVLVGLPPMWLEWSALLDGKEVPEVRSPRSLQIPEGHTGRSAEDEVMAVSVLSVASCSRFFPE